MIAEQCSLFKDAQDYEHIKMDKRLAVRKLIVSLTKGTVCSPLVHCFLMRCICQISRLDDETCKLDKCVADVKSPDERYHGTTYSKLRQMPTLRHIEAIQVCFGNSNRSICKSSIRLS
nr:hypothetical protein [Tanacetum cinerariifolium]